VDVVHALIMVFVNVKKDSVVNIVKDVLVQTIVTVEVIVLMVHVFVVLDGKVFLVRLVLAKTIAMPWVSVKQAFVPV